ncbi:MAG: MFS transporter [Pseudomonadota bacterium]
MAAFTPLERRAAASLSLVYASRMMGLFLLLPVMSVLGQDLSGSTPLLIGVALGIYGLFQALLQIPFGILSDRFGRKRVIYFGLALMVLGSLVAAAGDSIWQVIVGRALQGAGAISAAVMALAADLSRDSQRTKMMAIIGASIGLSFIASIMIGPLLMSRVGLNGIFLIIAFTGLLSALLVWLAVPDAGHIVPNRDFSTTGQQLRSVLADRELQRLDISIMILHLLITATFVCMPLGLIERGIAAPAHWQVYLAACALSLLVLIPLVALSERSIRRTMLFSIAGLAVAVVFVGLSNDQWWVVVAALGLFFGFVNVLESMLPSLVSRVAPVGARGSAMGVYSSSQFIGAFVGGVLGGWMVGSVGLQTAHIVLGCLCALWLPVTYFMQEPRRLSSYQLSLGQCSLPLAELESRLRAVAGVEEVLLVPEDQVAYLKVRRKQLDEQSLREVVA